MESSSFPENFSELFNCSGYTRIACQAERKAPAYRAIPVKALFGCATRFMRTLWVEQGYRIFHGHRALGARWGPRWLKHLDEVA